MLVGSLYKDSAGEWMRYAFDESILFFAEVILIDGISISKIFWGKLIN